jgi:hypothetical protein
MRVWNKERRKPVQEQEQGNAQNGTSKRFPRQGAQQAYRASHEDWCSA